MGSEEEEQDQKQRGNLRTVTFQELFDRSVLPSGVPYELMDDTVEVALAVAEVSEPAPWKEKAIRAFTVTKSVGNINVQEQGPKFVLNMLDTDVIFLGLAWTAQLNGTKLDIEEGGVPCPTCNHPFKSVDFGALELNVRDQNLTEPPVFRVEGIDPKMLPKSIQGSTLGIRDMTWSQSRKGVSEKVWEKPEAVKMHRILSGLVSINANGGVRDVHYSESKGMRAGVLRRVADVMDENIPNIEMQLKMTCEKCKGIAIVPFTQGLG